MTAARKVAERDFQRAVIDLATLTGWAHYHPAISLRSVAGWPDLVLCRPPEIVFVELKSSRRARVRPEQRVWLDRLRACDLEAHLWSPEDWPIIERRLTARRPSPPAPERLFMPPASSHYSDEAA